MPSRKSRDRRHATMKDVASRAGVSQTTVSLVMNDADNGSIPPSTRQRVWDAIAELGYRPNAAAKMLRVGKTHTVGFVTDVLASSPFAGDIVRGAQESAWNHHQVLMIINTGADQELELAAVQDLLERRVEGIIYAAMAHHMATPPDDLREIPTVLVNCFVDDASYASVTPDEFSGGSAATRALLQAGHRRIGFINLDPEIILPPSEGRLAGYRAALAEEDVTFDDTLICVSNGDPDDGYVCTQRLLNLTNRPTALFCATDRLAMGAYDAIRDRGLTIPEDISVVGFDNQEIIAKFLRPALSTVALPFYAMGELAAETLIAMTGETETTHPQQRKIPCVYVPRQSVAPPRVQPSEATR